MSFVDFMMIATMILGLVLITLVMVQGQTNGLGSMFGGSDIYRTRRGIEKTLFNVTFAVSSLFLLFALITVAFE